MPQRFTKITSGQEINTTHQNSKLGNCASIHKRLQGTR
ncbi:hypothetical protein SynWH8101_1015 [Synechococcus sp. WH 8101]|nr:hypothetical protein SynWH8101_1015 [Synechococcus sp. WH 8101]QNI44822.1 hypothetical protein SynRCC2555_01036 [Synechococcus sp. WH 8101]